MNDPGDMWDDSVQLLLACTARPLAKKRPGVLP